MDKSKYGAVRAERGKKSLPKVEEANNLLDIKYKYEGSQVAKSVKYVKDTKYNIYFQIENCGIISLIYLNH
jgi:hypothetical protein